MGVERESTVKKAENLVREGKPDLAIEEYLRLVEDQPGDVGAANALGDLYAKVGNRPLAVAQFVQIGDTHRESGFIPKAIAFYKKALKVDPASDHALSQLAQIAAEQEAFADATLYLNRLLQRRREQKNEPGVAECLMRLGGFPTATADAKLAAARAAAAHVPAGEASRLWLEAADALESAGRPREAVDVLMHAVSAETDDVALRRRVAVACADTGQIERARAFLSFETAGDRGDLLMALAEHALGEGRDDEARRALQRVIQVAPDRRADAEAMLAPLQPVEPGAESGEVTVDAFDSPAAAAPAADDWGVVTPDTATPVAGDLGWDALLGSGEAAEAASEPQPEAEPQAGPDAEPDAEPQAVGELGWDALLGDDENRAESEAAAAFDLGAAVGPDDAAMLGAGAGAEPDPRHEAVSEDDAPVILTSTSTELEWSELLGEGEETAGESGDEMPMLAPEPAAADDADTDAAFVLDGGPSGTPDWNEEPPVEEPPVEEPPVEEPQVAAPLPVPLPLSPADASTIAALTAAAENPALQFQAAAQLGRLLLRLDRGSEGVAWLERAIQATTAVREQRLDVMYGLADALERLGEGGRALDVFADLDFDAASYRDVPERIVRLRRALEEGRAP